MTWWLALKMGWLMVVLALRCAIRWSWLNFFVPTVRIGIAKQFLDTATRAQLMADMGMDSSGIVARVQDFFEQ